MSKRTNIALLAIGLLYCTTGMAQLDSVRNGAELRIRCAEGLRGNVAVSIADANVVKPDSVGGNIVSELLLSSELRGRVERPLDYFVGDNRARHDMDLLMLTQGWRRYPIDSVLNGCIKAPTDSFETDQSISGSVSSFIGSVKNITLNMLVPMTMERKTFKIDKRFIIVNLDFVDGTTFVLQATGRQYQDKVLRLDIDTLSFPRIHQEAAFARENTVGVPRGFYNQSLGALQFNRFTNSYELPGVTVEARKPNDWSARNIRGGRGFGENDPIFERVNSMSVLLGRLGTGISVGQVSQYSNVAVPRRMRTPRQFVKPGESNFFEPVIVVVNGMIAADESEMQEVVSMNPLDIKYIVSSSNGSVVLIRTKDGKEPSRFRLHKPLSVVTVRQLGYKPPVEFYVPRYSPVADGLKMDKRTTLYWNPSLCLDGESVVGFVPSDVSKSYLVTVEGVADDGTVIHEQTILKK